MNELITLGIFSSVVLFIWRQGGKLIGNLRNLFITTFEVHSSNTAYDYYLEFFDKYKSQLAFRNYRFSYITRLKSKDKEGQWYNGLGFGWHLIRYHKTWIFVNHQKTQSTMTTYWEVSTLYAYVIGNKKLIHSITKLLYDQSSGKKETKVYLYKDSWSYITSREKRSLNTIFWENDVKEKLLSDVNTFMHTKKEYLRNGTPYKRAYLLYGTPGTGKTSMVYALAGSINYNVSVLNLSTIETDNKLLEAFASVPNKSILLLEDIDLIFQKLNNVKHKDEHNRITFSGILNALDGITYKEGLITFMTTNHIDRIDSAILRDGRVDNKIEVGDISKKTAENMCKYYNKNIKDLGCIKYPVNPAYLQNKLLEK